MPSNTTNGYPYPLPTEPVKDGADAIKNLAEAVNTKARVSAAGTAVITISTAASYAQVSVTLPAGRFTSAPAVAVSSQGNTWICGCSAISATAMTLWARYYQFGGTSTGSPPVGWIASTPG